MPATTIPHLQPPEIVKRSVWEDRHERRVNNTSGSETPGGVGR